MFLMFIGSVNYIISMVLASTVYFDEIYSNIETCVLDWKNNSYTILLGIYINIELLKPRKIGSKPILLSVIQIICIDLLLYVHIPINSKIDELSFTLECFYNNELTKCSLMGYLYSSYIILLIILAIPYQIHLFCLKCNRYGTILTTMISLILFTTNMLTISLALALYSDTFISDPHELYFYVTSFIIVLFNIIDLHTKTEVIKNRVKDQIKRLSSNIDKPKPAGIISDKPNDNIELTIVYDNKSNNSNTTQELTPKSVRSVNTTTLIHVQSNSKDQIQPNDYTLVKIEAFAE